MGITKRVAVVIAITLAVIALVLFVLKRTGHCQTSAQLCDQGYTSACIEYQHELAQPSATERWIEEQRQFGNFMIDSLIAQDAAVNSSRLTPSHRLGVVPFGMPNARPQDEP